MLFYGYLVRTPILRARAEEEVLIARARACARAGEGRLFLCAHARARLCASWGNGDVERSGPGRMCPGVTPGISSHPFRRCMPAVFGGEVVVGEELRAHEEVMTGRVEF